MRVGEIHAFCIGGVIDFVEHARIDFTQDKIPLHALLPGRGFCLQRRPWRIKDEKRWLGKLFFLQLCGEGECQIASGRVSEDNDIFRLVSLLQHEPVCSHGIIKSGRICMSWREPVVHHVRIARVRKDSLTDALIPVPIVKRTYIAASMKLKDGAVS